MKANKILNPALFMISLFITGALAGAFVWLFFFLMGIGLDFIWHTVPEYFNITYLPIILCAMGGLVIGIYEKKIGTYPDELNMVMKTVKETGGYPHDKIGRSSVGALLPLIFGGSIGPEAGLTGAIAGLCTWAGERMKSFSSDFAHLSTIGVSAALTAIFTAPLFGFVAPIFGEVENDSRNDHDREVVIPKNKKIIMYALAIVGALVAFKGLGAIFGGSMGMPHYSEINITSAEITLAIPLAIVGAIAGWLYHPFNHLAKKYGHALRKKVILRATLTGIMLGALGVLLPFTMFAGETQAEELDLIWMNMGAITLIATGILKILITPICIHGGWRGGHFFPIIFSGIAIGYAMAILTGLDPVFCLCIVTSAVMGAVMRQVVLSAMLLILCFPASAVVVLLAGSLIGSLVPVPKNMLNDSEK